MIIAIMPVIRQINIKKGGDAVVRALHGELSGRAGKGRVFKTRKIA